MNRAFTLIELAIVLVIIGLMTGGVLAGRSLIDQAALKNVVSQLSEYNTGVTAFRGKYNGAIPGDFTKAYVMGLNSPEPDADSNVALTSYHNNNGGNGDGILMDNSGNQFTNEYSGEITNFWIELSNGKFIKDQLGVEADCNPCDAQAGVSFPASSIGSGILIMRSVNVLNGHYYVTGVGTGLLSLFATQLGLGGGTSENIAMARTLTPEQAYSFDQKLDNGDALTGNIIAIRRVGLAQDISDATKCFTTTSGVSTYNLSLTTQQCTLAIKANF